MTPVLLVHYQELALKGRNRTWFLERLVRNLREATAGCGVGGIRPIMGHIELALRDGAELASAIARVRETLGVARLEVARRVEADLTAIRREALDLVAPLQVASFRVRARRGDKSFPFPSPEIERTVGEDVHNAKGWPADLREPALVIRVNVVPGAAYVAVASFPGPAGLPVGVSGKVMCLFSGGIDSPVAAFQLMRRGCRVHLVHFHSHPITTTASQEKVRRLAALLARYQFRSRLALVPFAGVQRAIVAVTPGAFRIVLYRRFMLRIAEQLARRWGARALVTGEAIGQVASQTLENIAAANAAAEFPVLRPLIGMDKEWITAEARRIGTFSISVLPDEDCCQVFTPSRPAINVKLQQAEAIEAQLPVDELVSGALRDTMCEQFRYPAVQDALP